MTTSKLAATHPAVVTVTPSGPLEIHQVPTPTPASNEVLVLVQYTASTPLDLHQASAHLLVKPPQILGDGVAGTVIVVGPEVQSLQPGDKVFGFTWRNAQEKAHQLICCTTENLLGKIPAGLSMQEAVVLPNNFVTAWHLLTKDFGFELPWPKPENYVPKQSDTDAWILVWGGASSVGMYVLQILKWYGYTNIIAIASSKHERKLKKYGAKICFDYRDANVIDQVNQFVAKQTFPLRFVLDCIGHLEGSTQPLSKIAPPGSKVAVLLPVIVRDAAEGSMPKYTMDVATAVPWKQNVDAVGVRTHFYVDNAFLAAKLQSEIMSAALKLGVVEPNDQVIVEGKTLLERAEAALKILRDKKVSGARLVWKVAEDHEIEAYTRTL